MSERNGVPDSDSRTAAPSNAARVASPHARSSPEWWASSSTTNASRAMLMGLESCRWDEGILEEIGIPWEMLPEVTASSEVVGRVAATALPHLAGVPIAGHGGRKYAFVHPKSTGGVLVELYQLGE